MLCHDSKYYEVALGLSLVEPKIKDYFFNHKIIYAIWLLHHLLLGNYESRIQNVMLVH